MSWFDELLFPRRCPVCQDIIGAWGKPICDTCREKPRLVGDKGCFKCGRLLQNEEKEYCADCMRTKRCIIRSLTGFDYRDEWVHKMIFQVKYHNARQLLDYPCRIAAEEYQDIVANWQCDCLIPVPLHSSKWRKRGFNQAEEIARRIAAVWALPVDTKVLARVKKTCPQKDLDRAARQENLADAFAADENLAQIYSRVILVDDIYTTGSTMESCAKALLAAGVQQVYGFALSSGRDEIII